MIPFVVQKNTPIYASADRGVFLEPFIKFQRHNFPFRAIKFKAPEQT